MKNDIFRVLQVPFNVLDQILSEEIFPDAARQGVGIFIRSAFLKGVLTSQINTIVPVQLSPLREAALSALEYLDEEVSNLAEVALHFCLSFGEILSIIIGVRSIDELETNLAALDKGL